MPDAADSGLVTVWIPSLLRGLTGGQANIQVQGRTVRQLIDALEQAHPGLKDRLCDKDGLRPGIAVAVNGQLATRGLSEAVPDGAEVHFLPAISGGAPEHPRKISARDCVFDLSVSARRHPASAYR
jgi:molybdopterin synthase sulfur carrier subunit